MFQHDHRHVFRRMVSPESEYGPTGCSQYFGNFFVPLPILTKLFCPPFPIRLRNCTVLWAPMPKTPINKNSQFFRNECDINCRSTDCHSFWPVLNTKAGTRCEKQFSQCHFRSRVFAAYSLHYRRDQLRGCRRTISTMACHGESGLSTDFRLRAIVHIIAGGTALPIWVAIWAAFPSKM